jgi:tripartite-type tricarboxylate transporter receptor subunit TctC
MAGIEGNHIPYKGGGPSALALVQGESQWTMGPYGAYGSHVKSGRVRCLATGGDKRSALTPELPTIAEAGVTGFRYYGWNGVLAPRATPRHVVDKLNGVMREVLATTDLRQLYMAQGEEPAYSSVADFTRIINDDFVQMGKMVKLAGLKPE